MVDLKEPHDWSYEEKGTSCLAYRNRIGESPSASTGVIGAGLYQLSGRDLLALLPVAEPAVVVGSSSGSQAMSPATATIGSLANRADGAAETPRLGSSSPINVSTGISTATSLARGDRRDDIGAGC